MARELRGDRRHALEVLVREDGDGAALLHGLPEGAGRRRVRDTAGGGFPGFPELPDELEVPAARRQEEDPDAVEAEDVVDGLHERVEAVVALPGRLHREPGLVEPLEELAPLLALAEQPRLLDGDRRLVRERQQHGDLVRPEAARGAGVDVQVADHAVLRAQGHADESPEALLQRTTLVRRRVPGVRGQVLDGHGLAGDRDRAAQALPDSEAGDRHDADHRLRAGADHEVVAVAEPEAGAVRAKQPRGLVHDPREHGLRVVRGRHVARHLVQHLEPLLAPPRLLVEPHVLDEEPRLLAHALRQRQLALLERAPRGPPDGVDGPDHRGARDQRQDQRRPVRERAERLVGEARIVRDVVGVHGPTRAPERQVELPLAEREHQCRQPLQVLLRHVVGRRGDETVGVPVVEVRGDGVRPEQARQLAAGAPERLADVEGGADRGRDGGERFALRQPRLQRLLQLRVLPEQAPPLDDPPDDDGQAPEVHGLHDVARGAALDRLDGRLERGVARHDDHLGRRREPARLAHQVEAAHVGEDEVEEQQRDGALAEEAEPVTARARDEHEIALGLEVLTEEPDHLGVVVDQQDRVPLGHTPG